MYSPWFVLLEPGVMVCIPILTVFLHCPEQTSVQFCFPILKHGGMLSVSGKHFGVCA